MPVISISTLQFAIESVAAQLAAGRLGLEQSIAAEIEVADEDLERIDRLDRVAEELQVQYQEAAKTVVNLTPYDTLVGQGNSMREAHLAPLDAVTPMVAIQGVEGAIGGQAVAPVTRRLP